MGHRQVDQAALFYEFSLETQVPADHLLRSIDHFVELGELRRELASFYSSRCCSLTSSASSNWTAFDYEDQMVRATSSSSQQPPKTSGNWPS
jgi:hypothetical protein